MRNEAEDSGGTMPTAAAGNIPPYIAAPDGRRVFCAGEKILGRYEVACKLGQGGMGVVYGCNDAVSGLRVALKTVPPAVSENQIEMKEIRENFALVSRLNHPNIANLKTLERDPASGEYYVVMELVSGRCIKELAGKVAPVQLASLIKQIASALDYAHGERIIHRDIKPSNLMLDEQGNVKILDFGIASQFHEAMSRVSNVHFATSGTGPYMSPEQWKGEFQDGASDQYAMAAVAYELLAGKPPFMAHDMGVLRGIVLNEKARQPDRCDSQVWKVLARALSKDRKERFVSCSAFAGAFAEAAQRDEHATRGGGKKEPDMKSKKLWLAAACGLIALIVIGAVAANVFFTASRAEALLDRAVEAIERHEWSSAEGFCQQSLTLRDSARGKVLLASIPKFGGVSILSQPSGASVLLGGKNIGSTPLVKDDIPVGACDLTIQKEGCKSAQLALTIQRGKRTEGSVKLDAEAGSLRITTTPTGAKISINGQPVAGATPLALSGIKTGPAKIRAELPGHRPLEKDVSIAAGAENEIDLGNFVSSIGDIVIVTRPDGAVIDIEGTQKLSPASFAGLAEGQRNVLITKAGFLPLQKSITIRAGEAAQQQEFMLTPDPAAMTPPKPDEKPPVVSGATPASETAVPPRLARIAVVPAAFATGLRQRFNRDLVEKFGLTDPSVVENPGFTARLVDALVNMRKFEVLERDNLNAVVRELNLGESDYADPAKAARAGQMLNADYIIIPTIQNITALAETREIPYVNDTRTTYTSVMSLNTRIVDVRSSRIATSSFCEYTNILRAARKPADAVRQAATFFDQLYAAISAAVAGEIVDGIYPIRILSIEQGVVTLNRGTGALLPGETLAVLRRGEEIVDPDTRQKLGFAEKQVGAVKIIEVLPALSRAAIVEGGAAITKDCICKRPRPVAAVPKDAPPRL